MSTGAVKWLNSDDIQTPRTNTPEISASAKVLILGGLVPLFVRRLPPNVRLASVAIPSIGGWWKAYYDLRIPPGETRIEW